VVFIGMADVSVGLINCHFWSL